MQSERVRLRNFVLSDWEVYLELNTSKLILKYHYQASRMKSLTQIENDFKNLLDIENSCLINRTWVVEKTELTEMIGICTLAFKKNENEWQVGFRLLDREWKKGYATEILKELIKIGKSYKIEKLNAFVNIGNAASERVLAKQNFVLVSEQIIYNDWLMNKFELVL